MSTRKSARERLEHWAHRKVVRRARLITFRAKKRYWKARWRKLRNTNDMQARRHAAAMVRHYDDLIDATADLLERAKRGYRRAERDLAEIEGPRASKHFLIREFDCRDGTPVPKAAHAGVRRLCEQVLEPMRQQFGACHVTSGYRHRAYNAAIGGATASYHIYDLHPDEPAADVTFQRGTPAQWAAYARRLGKGGVGQYATFVHVDLGPRRDWWG